MTAIPRINISPEGPELSYLVQGYWRLAEWNKSTQQCHAFIKEHIELGITTVDHANIYGNTACESIFGEVLKTDPSLRDQVEIISKCGIVLEEGGKAAHYNSSKQSILSSVKESLQRLNTDYLDVLLIHRPDFLMIADEIAEAFDQLHREGCVKHFGVSNFTSAQLSLLKSRLDLPLVTNQIEINPLNLEVADSGILEDLQTMQIHPMAWSPLGGGRVFNEQSEQMERLRNTLNQLVQEIGASSIDQVVYTWIMKMPSKPIPVLGSGNISRIRSAAESMKLTMNHEQWYRLWTASKGHDVP